MDMFSILFHHREEDTQDVKKDSSQRKGTSRGTISGGARLKRRAATR